MMDGQVLQFPQTATPCAITRRGGRNVDAASQDNREARLGELVEKLAGPLGNLDAKQRREDEQRFANWLEGRRISPSAYISACHAGIATDHFGEGNDLFRWAVESVRHSDVLRPSQKDEALRLAIDQLNALGQLERLSRLSMGHSPAGVERDFVAQTFADLGRTLRRLATFGAICRPTAGERSLLERSKAMFF